MLSVVFPTIAKVLKYNCQFQIAFKNILNNCLMVWVNFGRIFQNFGLHVGDKNFGKIVALPVHGETSKTKRKI